MNEIGENLKIPEYQVDLLLTKRINALPALIRTNLLNWGVKNVQEK